MCNSAELNWLFRASHFIYLFYGNSSGTDDIWTPNTPLQKKPNKARFEKNLLFSNVINAPCIKEYIACDRVHGLLFSATVQIVFFF